MIQDRVADQAKRSTAYSKVFLIPALIPEFYPSSSACIRATSRLTKKTIPMSSSAPAAT